jgi:regulator of protease activity HflC (stomatin/prohibitin superfamily)
MIALKYLLELGAVVMFAGAAVLVAFDLYRRMEPRLAMAGRLAAMALLPLLIGLSIQVVPSGSAGIRVSQLSGTLPGALYPGTHFVVPLVQHVELYNIRDMMLTTSAADDPKKQLETLRVQTKEGLVVGLSVAVRYRIDPRRLNYIHASLPQPLERELVPPVVAAAFREITPNYLVRELFATERERIRRAAADTITKKLAADAILVKEVLLRDIALPAEYARGLEGLLLKAQENDRLAIEVLVKEKQVRTAELEAEAEKARVIKQAEANAQTIVLSAKAQADAMQYTLPLKEKQIEQTRLEAEARKESTIKGAEATAQAKVIDGKAELERRKLMNEAEVHRVQLTSKADADKLRLEAAVLKENPLLIQKIIAERLSDKVQIMMVPADGKYFFANDVLRSAMNLGAAPVQQPQPQ